MSLRAGKRVRRNHGERGRVPVEKFELYPCRVEAHSAPEDVVVATTALVEWIGIALDDLD